MLKLRIYSKFEGNFTIIHHFLSSKHRDYIEVISLEGQKDKNPFLNPKSRKEVKK